ncbi:SDR family NAD(P)-dependent oxidoreductase [Bacteroides sp. 224]|uniref:SDR family NAD(P)-dependent oxidoreductase n=1 Tax=Bacteroides sp. 224 TaxID=2302936 RepID=UPI0013D748D0|nr:SDR family NAD(P)-dependent oxidoreductase [Bacteroides sp. 224]NDV64914.1 SDR family NAD(P)-dependent oxidoreductase [Bacteroides sp. 224]
MDSKIILVTGASDGIGKETAMTLAKQGHTIIIHGRNKQKLQAVYNDIKAETGNTNIDMFTADFLSFAEIKRFADTIKQKYDRLDILVNNAGAQFTDKRETTIDGHEKTMMINVFAPFLLTTLLLDLLKKSPSARVVTVSSASHKMGGKPDLNDIELKNNYTMSRAYGFSKLYVIWVMRHFITETKKAGINNITFNCVHPASTQTNLARESSSSLRFRIIMFLWKPMLISLAKGAKSSIEAGVSPKLEGVTGKYFGPKGEEKVSDKYYSTQNEQIIWDYCLKVTEDYR